MSALTAIIVLGILIFVHELGHFLLAKLNGVGVLEFALGFGPKIIQFTVGETTYSLRSIPLGGFVRMVGDDPRAVYPDAKSSAQAEEARVTDSGAAGGASPMEGSLEHLTPKQKALFDQTDRWFLNQGFIPKASIVLAGPVFNLIFAWLLAVGFFYVRGIPTAIRDRVVIGDVFPGLPAEKAGLKVHDTITSVDGRPLREWKELIQAVTESQGRPLEVEIFRPDQHGDSLDEPPPPTNPGQTLKFSLQPSTEGAELDLLDGKKTTKPTYKIGIGAATLYRPADITEAITAGALQVYGIASTTYRVLYGLVTLSISPRKTIGGPIQMIHEVTKSAERGLGAIAQMMIFFNVMLAVMNLLPIPVLDGGHLLMFVIEKIKGAPLSLKFQEIATQIGMGVLLMLMMFAVGNDLVKLFS